MESLRCKGVATFSSGGETMQVDIVVPSSQRA